MVFFLIFSHNTFIINFLDYDLSKMRDFINHQADVYVEKGILDKEEANAIKRIYSSLWKWQATWACQLFQQKQYSLKTNLAVKDLPSQEY